jgi:three-Cys-motif partner protein
MIARASDGLPARLSGSWTRDKLADLQRYAEIFMTAMAPKRSRGLWSELVYLDFLAGPGRGLDRQTRAEFDGSPLRALKIVPRFDRLYLSDADASNVDALRRRIQPTDAARVVIRHGDCHEIAASVVSRMSKRSLGLAFVDPQGFEVKFKLFEILAQRRIDVLYLFPGGIGVTRNVAAFARRSQTPLDNLIPCWRALPRARLAAGQRVSQAEMEAADRPFVVALQTRMVDLGYLYSDQGEPYFTNDKRVQMYHLLFFSRHVTGLTLWKQAKAIEPSGQRRLPL